MNWDRDEPINPVNLPVTTVKELPTQVNLRQGEEDFNGSVGKQQLVQFSFNS
jgi:hypothetical protein